MSTITNVRQGNDIRPQHRKFPPTYRTKENQRYNVPGMNDGTKKQIYTPSQQNGRK